MQFCIAPFCPNPKYIHKGKSHGYCREHITERVRFKVKSFREVLPFWAFTRCKVHGLLNFDQTYQHRLKDNKIKFICRKCTQSYVNAQYDPHKAKVQRQRLFSQKKSREMKCKYGITLEEYNLLLEKQNYGCAICETKTLNLRRKHFDIDHCHKSKKVRGLLCHSCNVGIGFLQDNISILQKAISYLA